ncbi:MAG: hypothetical protein Q4C54_00615 [Clostridia bacterium]|nr:hypothetical protein [Clostridia bacterium]
MAEMIFDDVHKELRERLMRFDMTLRGLLYIRGVVPFEEALEHLVQDAMETDDPDDIRLCQRYLHISCDFICRMDGRRFLLHPGLAEPEPFIAAMGSSLPPRMDEMTLLSAVAGILPEEAETTLQMIGLIQDAVRPETNEDEAVQDLRILAKQGVGMRDMQEVLASMLTQQPTPAMLQGLRQLVSQTTRWGGMKAAVLN